jgi:hypothetical protein
LPIPTLRELKELPPAEPAAEQSAHAADRGESKRRWLLVGLMFAIIVLAVPAAIFFTYQRLTMDTSYTEELDRQQAFAELDAATPAELSAAWNDFSTQSLGVPTKPNFYYVQLYKRILEWRMAVAWGIALLAAIVAGSVFAIRRERRSSEPSRSSGPR